MKKKILIISNHDMGIYKFRKELLSELKKEHEVFLSVPRGNFTDELESLGITIIDTVIDRRGTNILSDLKLLNKYVQICRNIKPNVVLTYTIKPNIYGGLACQLLKIPYFSNITGFGTSLQTQNISQKLIAMLYKYGLKKSKCVFFQNFQNIEIARRIRIIDKQNTHLLPGSGVNLLDYHLMASNEKKLTNFLFVGRIMKDKGIGELIEVIPSVLTKQKDVHFTIVGPMEEDYINQLENLSYQYPNNFSYEGEQANIQGYLQKVEALILPSYHEGLSNVLLEAAASGRAVLASNIPGCQETFIEGQSGFGFETKNPKSLQEAIEKFLKLGFQERKQLGINGRKHIEANFSRQIVIDAYLKELHTLFTDGGN
ncbi:MAG: glycosyltransferase family 4 protein [Culicoidibacterales bacterium]